MNYIVIFDVRKNVVNSGDISSVGGL